MEYVQVPVPEEHVNGVLEFLQTRQYALFSAQTLSAEAWDPVSVARVIRDLDVRGRALVRRAADVAVAAENAKAGTEVAVLTVRDAAADLGCTEREILGRVVEMNDLIRCNGGPMFALVTGDLDGAPGLGPFSWPITMAGDAARFLLSAVDVVDDADGTE